MKRWVWSMALVLIMGGIVHVAAVNNQGTSRYDLYSWKNGTEWEYSLLPYSRERRIDAEIRQSGKLRGAGKIKEKILSMKEGDVISWHIRSDRGMVYPPEGVMQDILDYARSVGVKLLHREGLASKP